LFDSAPEGKDDSRESSHQPLNRSAESVEVTKELNGPVAVVAVSVGVSLLLAQAEVDAACSTLKREEHVDHVVLVDRGVIEQSSIGRRFNSFHHNGSSIGYGSINSGSLGAGDFSDLFVTQHITNHYFLSKDSLVGDEKHVLVGNLKRGSRSLGVDLKEVSLKVTVQVGPAENARVLSLLS